jgi:hypothetical protein
LAIRAGHDRPRQGDAREQLGGADRGHDVCQVVILERELPRRRGGHGLVVGSGEQLAHYLLRGPARRDRQRRRRIDAVLAGPRPPGAHDGRVGVKEGPVHVKQHGVHGSGEYQPSADLINYADPVYTGTYR